MLSYFHELNNTGEEFWDGLHQVFLLVYYPSNDS